MNEKLGELLRAVTEDASSGSDVGAALREMTKQHEMMAKMMLQTLINQQQTFERALQSNTRLLEKLVDRQMAIVSPQALRVAATLDRAGTRVSAAPAPTGAHKVSPDGEGPGSSFFFHDDDGEEREAVDVTKILADSAAFSGAAFQPPQR